jgi:hypothetical protein
MYMELRVKYTLFLPDFMKIEFFQRFSKNTQISNFIKIRQVGAEFFFHTDGWTDRQTDRTDMQLIVAFRNFS